jgi:CheY-like chemotaxis protein
MLPEMDGFELCRTIRRRQRHPPHHAHRARRGDGPRGGAGAGRRRLRAQALRAARAGGARADRAAPARTAPAPAADPPAAGVRRPAWTPPPAACSAGRAAGADQHRVRPAAPAGARARQGVQPRRHPEPRCAATRPSCTPARWTSWSAACARSWSRWTPSRRCATPAIRWPWPPAERRRAAPGARHGSDAQRPRWHRLAPRAARIRCACGWWRCSCCWRWP